MTIKQQGGIFGRNPTFNNVAVDGTLTVDAIVEKTAAAGISLDGVTLKDGNVVLDSGKGIDFYNHGTGTNITSNLLNDYEIGTWTPSISAGAISGTSNAYSGSYTKVGNQVTITFKVVNTAGDIHISSYAVISGLPFAASSDFGGTSTVTAEDIEVLARQGFASIGNGSSSLGLSAAGSASGTVKLIVSLTYLT